MSIPVIVGIDQGSSHTRAVVAVAEGPETGRLLGVGRAAGACHAYDGMDAAMSAVAVAVSEALVAAGAEPADVGRVCAGMTGADWPNEVELLRRQLAKLTFGPSGERFAGPVRVTNDCIAALRGGTAEPYGAILVAGTGANCAARSPAGEEFIYGYYHDDELQGGMALGRAALWAVYRAHTGRGPATSLTPAALGFFGLAGVDELRRGQLEHRLPHPVKDLAPLVFEEADRGDKAAAAIVTAFAQGSAGLVLAALARFAMLDMPLDVVLSGSIFKARGPLLVSTLAAAIHRRAPRARLVNARYEPVVGAALLALEQGGAAMTDDLRGRVETSAARLGLLRADSAAL